MHPKGTSRGLIQVDPGDSDEDLRSQTTCESAVILHIRRLGKTNYALVTFDMTAPPRTVRNYLELCKVKPYVPRTLVCYRCHRDGHLQKHCPNPAVCSQCGRPHEEDECPDATPYCNLCKKTGHTARDTNCQLKISRLKIMQKRMQQRSLSPARRHITGSEPSFPCRQYNISSTVDFPHLSPTPHISPTTARLQSRERSGSASVGNKRKKQPRKVSNNAPSSEYLDCLSSKITALQTELSSLQQEYKHACAAQARKTAELKAQQENHATQVLSQRNSTCQTSGFHCAWTATEVEHLISRLISKHLDIALSKYWPHLSQSAVPAVSKAAPQTTPAFQHDPLVLSNTEHGSKC
ncbi:hypothetical protein HPB48_004828 [Haemaphysalis longicornis]|uniref:CCHC-type domain-containing protein n=1 Tax=Haemaphysalis longicornis TaxID=44386 RepID=A0A9J6GUI8_HAELO|nr:hypothetical protein HPB48_004828 [Haemaphysalis longicornis]